MKITLLDKNTITTTEDIDFTDLTNIGELISFDNLQDCQQIIEQTQDSDIILLNKIKLDEELIEQLSSTIKLIVITATGYDNVDIKAATNRGIKVANVPGYGTESVAQLTLQLMLNLANQFPTQLDLLYKQGWSKQTALTIPMHELAGKTLGIIGLGTIGQEVARLAHAFNMIVIGYSREQKFIPYIRQVSLDELATNSDYISLNCALNQHTAQIINHNFLAKVKPTAFLINTARGGLINEVDLANALKNKQLKGAALDVLENEPPLPECPLLDLENVILTAHIGWATLEARQRCIKIASDNIRKFILNQPQNLLN